MYIKLFKIIACLVIVSCFSSLPLSAMATIQSSQSFVTSPSQLLGNISKHFFLTINFLGSRLSFPLPLMLDLKRVLSNNLFTSAVDNDLLVLYFIMMGHKMAGWISSSSYTKKTNQYNENKTIMYINTYVCM